MEKNQLQHKNKQKQTGDVGGAVHHLHELLPQPQLVSAGGPHRGLVPARTDGDDALQGNSPPQHVALVDGDPRRVVAEHGAVLRRKIEI